jgi:signal transduction histidine kinase
MEVHSILDRQLKRFNLSLDALPNNIDDWHKLLNRISRVYADLDQERYLLERSMDISSKEMLDLNSRLEKSQQIASLGYWNLNLYNDSLALSKTLAFMLQVEIIQVKSIRDFIDLIHSDDKEEFSNYLATVQSNNDPDKSKNGIEIRFVNKSGYSWHYVLANLEQGISSDKKEISGISMDITKRKYAEQEINTLHQELVDAARIAGQADVIVSILHNIGNVLNSVGISVNTLLERSSGSVIKQYIATAELLRDNQSNLNEYLLTNPKGKIIPQYLIKLSDVAKEEYEANNREMTVLSKHVGHIRDIISSQQKYSKGYNILSQVNLKEVIELSLQVIATSIDKYNIKIIKDYEDSGLIFSDKTKIMQIVVNLLSNAKDALVKNKLQQSPEIAIQLNTTSDAKICITIKDNGVGIKKEDLPKIFSFGFTTKPSGHGFGLHSASVAAKELGGDLEVFSQGEGFGATFVLVLDNLKHKSGIIKGEMQDGKQ